MSLDNHVIVPMEIFRLNESMWSRSLSFLTRTDSSHGYDICKIAL